GIDSGADSKAFKSFMTTENVQGGRIAADGLADAIKGATGKEEGEVVILTNIPGVGSLEQRREGFLDQVKTKYPGLKV
ncbi:ABC transporter substrate-binding protein, partial [Rhizobium ruizarguesonis]